MLDVTGLYFLVQPNLRVYISQLVDNFCHDCMCVLFS